MNMSKEHKERADRDIMRRVLSKTLSHFGVEEAELTIIIP